MITICRIWHSRFLARNIVYKMSDWIAIGQFIPLAMVDSASRALESHPFKEQPPPILFLLQGIEEDGKFCKFPEVTGSVN